MNDVDATCGNGERKLFQQAALPLPFAVRAALRFQPAGAGDPNHRTQLHIPTRPLPDSAIGTHPG
jgi:hypothetical protein